jgi:hypothetical protein
VGYFFSTKSGAPLQFGSLLERDFLILAETDPKITSIMPQPLEVQWSLDGTIQRHIPAYLIVYRQTSIAVEVALRANTAKQPFQTKTRIIGQILEAKGILHRVLSEDFIRAEPNLSRAKSLLHGVGCMPNAHENERILRTAAQFPNGLSIKDLCQHAELPPDKATTILALILSGEIETTDRYAEVDIHSVIKLTSSEELSDEHCAKPK